MATIDNLNFKVIIDDKDFNAKIKQMEDAAKKFNASMSRLLDVNKAAEQWSQKDVENNRKAWQAKVDEARAQEKINQAKIKTDGLQRKINAQIDRATKGYQSQSRILGELKGLALGYLSIHGVTQLLSSLIRVTGEFELQKTTLSAMIGDLNTAEQIITKIKGLAVESPFQFKELTTYAKQLSAFSVPAQELYDTTKMLADVSAGLGVGMDRIVLAYGQVRSAAFLRGQEVRQFTEAGIPILHELAKQFSELEGRAVSTGEVFDKISARLVPFEMVAKVFKDMTAEGGKFYNMQEIQAETLRGKISNLKDAYEVMLNEIGENQSERLKGAVDELRKMMNNYEEVGRQILQIVAVFGVAKTAVELLSVSMGKLNFKNVGVIHSLRDLAALAMKNPYTLLAAGITAAGVAMYKSNDYVRSYKRLQESITKDQEKFNKSLASETAKLDSLYAKLRLAKEGTEEYDKAKRKIYTQYAGYISELKNEGVEVGNLAALYGVLKTKINEAAQAKYRTTASQNLEQRYAEGIDESYEKFEKTVRRIEKQRGQLMSEFEKEGFWKYLLGDDDVLKENPELHGINNYVDQEIKSGDRRIEWLRKSIKRIIDEYQKGREQIDALFGEETDEGIGLDNLFNIPEETEKASPADKVQDEIDAVRRLKEAYDTLAPYMNGEMLRKTLTALFPNADQQLIQSLDFRGKLVELAAQLNQFDQEASKKLLDSISGEKASEIASAFKAIETYKNMLDNWLGEDFNLTGEGVTFDISKILRDLNNQYAKINKKAIEANNLLTKAQMGDEEALATVREVLGEEVWNKYLVNGESVIDELARKERDAARKTADEKIRDLSQKYVKELMTRDNITLTDFDDKTLGQIDELINRLYGLRAEIGNNMFALELGGVSEDELAQYQMLEKALEQVDTLIKDTDVEKEKKLFDNLSNGLKAISQLGGEISNLGEAIGDADISRLGKDLEKAADLASGLAEAMKAKDTIAIIANVLAYAISEITEVATAAYEYQRALNDASREYQDIMNDIRRESYSGLFGTDEIALAAENQRILTESLKDYSDSLKAFENDKKLRNQKFFGNRVEFKKMSVSDVVENIADASGWDLYRENGELNMDALIAYYDSYAQHLTKEQKGVVDALISSYQAQNDAAAQSAEYMKSVFSGAADSIANDMVAAFIESGDAAIDMRSIVSDVASDMASDLIKSLYIMPILNDYAEDLKTIMDDTTLSADERTAQALGLFQTAVSEIEGNKDAINETLAKLDEFFLHPEEGEDALGAGIKGMTEDTANLLASYLNAIRADVSYSKELWQKMDANTQAIANALVGFSAPTLLDYQKRIEANTYDNMIATQEILAGLRRVMTSESGATSIRVYREN